MISRRTLGARLDKSKPPCRLCRPFHERRNFDAMHAYRTHTGGALRLADAGQSARLSGWVHRKRDHGQLLFVDLRDHYGVIQCVIDVSSPLFAAVDAPRLESVITVTRQGVARPPATPNPNPAPRPGEVGHWETSLASAGAA